MTDNQITQWQTERDIARAIKDPEERRNALEKVYDHRDEMQMKCIAHQSGRVKDLLSDVATIKAELKPIKSQYNELEVKKIEARGFIKAVKVLKWVGAIGGGAGIVKVCEFFPKFISIINQ